MADRSTLEQLIAEHGGVLVRSKNHLIYRFPNGKQFTAPCTPRCPHAYENAIHDLLDLLGLNDPNRGQPGERRERKRTQPTQRVWQPYEQAVQRPTWRDKLAEVRGTLDVSFEQAMQNMGVRPL